MLPIDRWYYNPDWIPHHPALTENVTWFVLTAPEPMSQGQAHAFGRIYPRDARPTQPLNGILVPSVTASQVLVTPDNRWVIHISLISGAVSIWMVPLEGGTPTKLADGLSASVSPVGMSLAFTDHRGEASGVHSSRLQQAQTLGSVPVETPIAWAPRGRRVAYGAEGNVWVQPLGRGSPLN